MICFKAFQKTTYRLLIGLKPTGAYTSSQLYPPKIKILCIKILCNCIIFHLCNSHFMWLLAPYKTIQDRHMIQLYPVILFWAKSQKKDFAVNQNLKRFVKLILIIEQSWWPAEILHRSKMSLSAITSHRWGQREKQCSKVVTSLKNNCYPIYPFLHSISGHASFSPTVSNTQEAYGIRCSMLHCLFCWLQNRSLSKCTKGLLFPW